MKVSAYFYSDKNCSNYAPPDLIEDIEYFDSLNEVENELWRRINFDHKYPCLDDRAYFYVVKGIVESFEYPDYIISIGLRGGIRREKVY